LLFNTEHSAWPARSTPLGVTLNTVAAHFPIEPIGRLPFFASLIATVIAEKER